MTRTASVHRCRECAFATPRWSGRCPGCGAWNTMDEEVPAARSARPGPAPGPGGPRMARRSLPADPLPLGLIGLEGMAPWATGVDEVDRVLGGGLVPGSVTLLAGEPGVGKSTLLLQVLGGLAAAGRRALLVSAEESPEQVAGRAARLSGSAAGVQVCGSCDLPDIERVIAASGAEVVVVDSIQTISDPESSGVAGSVSQVRSCAQALVDRAKETPPGTAGPAVVLVGHVTKDGSVAGPRSLEHLVDTVLTFEGDRHHALRTLRAVKHRFGPAGELGLFEMTSSGLAGVPDAGSLLLSDRQAGAAGSVIFAALDGRRPLLVEIQALVGPAHPVNPGSARRSAAGYDSARLAQLLAVLGRWARLDLAGRDVYVSAAGGISVAEPAADLAVALAVASTVSGWAVPDDLVVMGEVGLGGELRRVPQLDRRVTEATAHGFRSALVPAGSPETTGLRLERVRSLAEAVDRYARGVPGSREERGRDGRPVGHGGVLAAAKASGLSSVGAGPQ